MAHFLDDTIDDLMTALSNASVAMQSFANFMKNAADHLKADQIEDAGVDLHECYNYAYGFRKWLVQDPKSVAQVIRDGLVLLRTNWPEDGEPPEEYELTMDKILAVMVA
ncbi:unnamed protein product, partial [marine sediment metagenome]